MTITQLHNKVKRRFIRNYRSSTVLTPEQSFEMSTTLAGGDFSISLLGISDVQGEQIEMCMVHIDGHQFIVEADADLVFGIVYHFGEASETP